MTYDLQPIKEDLFGWSEPEIQKGLDTGKYRSAVGPQ